MVIAAFHIPKGYLPNVFGESHPPLTINFGGKNLYTFEGGQLSKVEPNKFYIDDIFSKKGISLVSSVVGNNGSGKTTLMRALANSYHCKYVLEKADGTYEITDNIESIHRIYYTPYLHDRTEDAVRTNGKDLSKFAVITLDNHGSSGQLADFLKAHNSEKVKRWIKFNHFYRQLEAKKVPLPVFGYVRMELNHFDADVHNTHAFHQTSSQLRPAISQIFEKMPVEQDAKFAEYFERDDLEDEQKEAIERLIRFEYDLYEVALGKLVNVLEARGNRYLEEGFIAAGYEHEIQNRTVRDSMLWFLENAGVVTKEKYSFSEHISLIEFIDYIMKIVSPEILDNDNWRHIWVTEEQAFEIITIYDKFNQSFINDWFVYDKRPMFTYVPDIVPSSGEEGFLDLFSTLYSHSENIKNKIDIDFHSSDSLSKIGKNIFLLLDEGDNAFHPQWKKEYIKYIREVIPIIFRGYEIQVTISTHDPLTLSDFPKNNVVFLEKNGFVSRIKESSGIRTFGANISDLLKDSFFIQDGQIGSFVAGAIDWAINAMLKNQLSRQNIEDIERLIYTIDEPIIKFKLAEMLSDCTGNKDFEKDLLDLEIQRLEERRKRI
ncbi:hypothetical protein [Pedobacter namyangjuensis]|uniref:hypothetical protein n=1 Tax=Pedobacter namyangjuensis TaxID=600626 RepID=UPI000DE3274C|nr:hypothetical protein [Pedobacter namyangjuensis]